MAKFCGKCGSQLADEAVFCFNCGANLMPQEEPPVPVSESGETTVLTQESFSPVEPVQPYAEPVQPYAEPVQPYAEPVQPYVETAESYMAEPEQNVAQTPVAQDFPVQKKKKKKAIWMIPVAVVLVLAIAAALLWQPIMLHFAPKAYLAMATEKTFSAMAKREENSPGALMNSAEEILKDGTIDISVEGSIPEVGQTDAALSISMNQEAKKYAINANAQMLNQEFSADLYMDGSFMAIHLNPFTDGKYYGLTYSSFDEDIRSSAFADMLDDPTMDMLSETIEQLDKSINDPVDYEQLLKPYMEKIIAFSEDLDTTVGSGEISLDGKKTKCDTITVSFEQEQFSELLEELLDMAEEDEQLRDSLSASFAFMRLEGDTSDAYAELIQQLREGLEEMDEIIDSDTKIVYYIRNGTLVGVGIESELSSPEKEDDLNIDILLNFGANPAEDDIVLEVEMDAGDESVCFELTSSVEKDDDRYQETNTFVFDAAGSTVEVEFTSDWNRKTGKLTFNVETCVEDQATQFEFFVTLKETDKGFEVRIDDLYQFVQGFTDEAIEEFDFAIAIAFSKGSDIKTPEYINLDKIDETTLEDLLGQFGFAGEGEEDIVPPGEGEDDSYDDDWIDEVKDVYYKDSYSVSDQEAAENMFTTVAALGNQILTSGDLQVYYWLGVYDFLGEYGDYVEYLGLDYQKPLDEQEYDDNGTWQHYFLEYAIEDWQQYCSLAMMAEEAGFELDDDLQSELDGMYADLAVEAASQGYSSVNAMLQGEFGAGCTFDNYYYYMKQYYLGYMYYTEQCKNTSITDDMVENYFAENEDYFEALGITKESGNIYNVRHILFLVEDDDAAAWADAEKKAQDLLDQWIASGATEEEFAKLANTYSEDGGSNSNGGLYEYLDAETSFVPEFVEWYMEDGRQVGDYGLIKTDYGYHLMYCSDIQEEWKAQAYMELMDEASQRILDEALEKYSLTVYYEDIVLGVVDLSEE